MMLEAAPDVLYVVVILKLPGALNIFDPMIYHSLTDLGEYHRVDSFVLIFRKHGDEQGVDSVVFPESPQNVDETEREEAAFGFLKCLGQGWKRDAEADDLVILVHDDGDEIEVQITYELVLEILALSRSEL